MEREPLFVGIDIGTSGCRAVAIDRQGRAIHNLERDLPAPDRQGERSEQDPELWWQAVSALLAELAARSSPHRLAAVTIDGTSATTLVCDAALHPLAPALMYDDRRSRREADQIAARAPAESAARGASSSLAKALYLYRRAPFAAHVLHQADWLTARLTGRGGLSDENNALKLGYDPVVRRWPAWLDDFLPRSVRPRVMPPGTAIGPVEDWLCRDLGVAPGLQVVSGTTDSTAAFLATGASEPGDAVTSLGSTLVVKVLAERPVFSAEHGVYSHRLGDAWLVGGASNSGGAVLLEHFSRAQLQTLSAQLQPDAPTGLDYYPLCRPGERFPVADPDLVPRLQPRPDDSARFLQGMLEGIARIEADGYRLLQRLGAPYPRAVRSVGGGAANSAWSAIRARLLGVPLLSPEHTDAAYGAALLARRGVDCAS